MDYGSTSTDPSVISISSATATDAAALIDRQRLGGRYQVLACRPFEGFFAGTKACRVFYHGNGTEDVYQSPYIDSFEYGANIQILLESTPKTLKFVKADVKDVFDRLITYINVNIDRYNKNLRECLYIHSIQEHERSFLSQLIEQTVTQLHRVASELQIAIDTVSTKSLGYANNVVIACRGPLSGLVTNITTEYKSTNVVTQHPNVAILYNIIDSIFEDIYDLLDLTETPYTKPPPIEPDLGLNSSARSNPRSKRGGGLDDELNQSTIESENQGVVELFGDGNYGGYIYVMDGKQFFIMFSSQQEADDYVAAQNVKYVEDFKENTERPITPNKSLMIPYQNPMINTFKNALPNDRIAVAAAGGYRTRKNRNKNKNKSRKNKKTIRRNKKSNNKTTNNRSKKHKNLINHIKTRRNN